MKQTNLHRKQQHNILSRAAPLRSLSDLSELLSVKLPPNDLGGCGSISEPAAVGNKSLVPLLVQTQVYADLEADSKI